MKVLYLDTSVYNHLASQPEATLRQIGDAVRRAGWLVFISEFNLFELCAFDPSVVAKVERAGKILAAMHILADERILCPHSSLLIHDLIDALRTATPSAVRADYRRPALDAASRTSRGEWRKMVTDRIVMPRAQPFEKAAAFRKAELTRLRDADRAATVDVSQDAVTHALVRSIRRELEHPRGMMDALRSHAAIEVRDADHFLNLLTPRPDLRQSLQHWIAMEWVGKRLAAFSQTQGFTMDYCHAAFLPSVDGFVVGDSKFEDAARELSNPLPWIRCRVFSRLSEVSDQALV